MSPQTSCTTLPMPSPSSSSSSSSISVAINVEGNEDLLIEILLFLSEKSLVRFKSVSKRWLSLISTLSFCRRHTLHQPRRRRETQPLLIIGGHRSKYYVCNPTIPRKYPCQLDFQNISEARILESCNGLLLLEEEEEETVEGAYYYVFNPIMKQKRKLSPLPTAAFEDLYLMFDPFLSPHYKVACFASPTKEGTLIYLYSSEWHEWKLCGKPFDMNVSLRHGFYFNGGIYFPTSRCSLSFTHDYYELIKIPDPPGPPCSSGTSRRHSNEYVSNGVILCLTFCWNKGSNQVHVWEMKENESEWSKKYEADMNPVLAMWGGGDGSIASTYVIWGEKEQYAILLSNLPRAGEMKIYKFHDDVFVDIEQYFQQFRKDIPEWRFCGAHHFFTQTLAPL